MKKALVIGIFLLFLAVGLAEAATISDTATGSPTPGSAIWPDTVTSGDFTYTGNEIAFNVGDGNDEGVSWMFDFTDNPCWPTFPIAGPLTSALLTLTLTPQNALITTDAVRIEAGFPFIITPIIQSLPVGVESTITLELLDFYESSEILGVLAGLAGRIPMAYNDDAILTFAQLDLTTAPVISCNAPANITPPDTPISFTASVANSCGEELTIVVTKYDCFGFAKEGKRIDKTESCMVSIDGDTITINDAGGVGDIITWEVRVSDSSGNSSTSTCTVNVVNPAK